MPFKLVFWVFCLILVLSGCKKDDPETVDNCTEQLQYIEYKHIYYDTAGIKLFTIPSPDGYDGNYYYFCGKEAKHLVFCIRPDSTFRCLSPQEMESIYFLDYKVRPVWHYQGNQDTLVADLQNPGDTVLYNGIGKIRIVAVRSNFAAANTAACE